MWTWITEDAGDADRVLREVLAPMLRRDPDGLSDQLCIGSAEHCAELLSRYAQAGCERVYSGRSATSRGRSSSLRRPCFQPSARQPEPALLARRPLVRVRSRIATSTVARPGRFSVRRADAESAMRSVNRPAVTERRARPSAAGRRRN